MLINLINMINMMMAFDSPSMSFNNFCGQIRIPVHLFASRYMPFDSGNIRVSSQQYFLQELIELDEKVVIFVCVDSMNAMSSVICPNPNRPLPLGEKI